MTKFLINISLLSSIGIIFVLFKVGNFNITISYLILALLYMIFLIKFIFNQIKLENNDLIKVLIVFASIVSFSSIIPLLSGSEEKIYQALKTQVHLIFVMLFPFVLYALKPEKDTIKTTLIIFLIASIFVNFFGVYQIFARAFDLPLAWLDLSEWTSSSRVDTGGVEITQLSLQFKNFYRATSIFSEPSHLAKYNLIILAILFFPSINNISLIKSKIISITILILSFITLFFTFSMTGVIGFCLLLFIFLIFEKSFKIKKFLAYASIFLLVLLIGDTISKLYFDISVLELFYDRILGILGLGQKIDGESLYARTYNIQYSFETWANSPIFGIGPGQTYLVHSEFMFSDYGILHILIEQGILGLFIILLLPIYFFSELSILFKYKGLLKGDYFTFAQIALYTTTVLFSINALTGNQVISTHFWIEFGFAFVCLETAKKELKKAKLKNHFA